MNHSARTKNPIPTKGITSDSPTVLIIDDNDALRAIVIRGLQKNGFNVLQAPNGHEGVQMAQRETPDLILCDLNMGEKNDAEIFALLRKNPGTAHIPFILMTGQPEEDSPGDEVLAKPFALPALLQTIRTQLGQRTMKGTAPGLNGSPGFKKVAQQKEALLQVPSTKSGESSADAKPSMEQLEELLAWVQTLREEERTRVARAIHDDLTQTLTVVAIKLSLLDSTLNAASETIMVAECVPAVKKLLGLANNLIKSAQEITAQLRPQVLDEFGLVAALEWLIPQVEKKTGMKCELFLIGEEQALEPKVGAELYRLSEEILLHQARHAHATTLSLRVTNGPGYLSLEINDNGIETEPPRNNSPISLSLLEIRERVKRVRGSFQVRSASGKGTKIQVRIPLNQ